MVILDSYVVSGYALANSRLICTVGRNILFLGSGAMKNGEWYHTPW